MKSSQLPRQQRCYGNSPKLTDYELFFFASGKMEYLIAKSNVTVVEHHMADHCIASFASNWQWPLNYKRMESSQLPWRRLCYGNWLLIDLASSPLVKWNIWQPNQKSPSCNTRCQIIALSHLPQIDSGHWATTGRKVHSCPSGDYAMGIHINWLLIDLTSLPLVKSLG